MKKENTLLENFIKLVVEVKLPLYTSFIVGFSQIVGHEVLLCYASLLCYACLAEESLSEAIMLLPA